MRIGQPCLTATATVKMSVAAMVVFSVVTLVAVSPAGGATPKKWRWTETYAEQRVTKTVLVPCKRVRRAAECVLADAIAEAARLETAIANCKTINANLPERAYQCLLSLAQRSRSPEQNLSRIRRGFPVAAADCVGGGDADKSGYRFPMFRCKVTVADTSPANKPVVVKGRIVLYVTGSSTFRWALI